MGYFTKKNMKESPLVNSLPIIVMFILCITGLCVLFN